MGEPAVFSVDAPDAAAMRWQLDGTTVGAGPTWTFEPGPEDIGRHVVRLAVAGPTGVTRRRWDVWVRPPRLPRVAAREPATDTVSVEVGREVVLRFDARPATPGESVRIVWTVDGAPAGEGDTLRWSASEPADVRVRALAVGSLGAVVGQDWRIQVRLPTTTTTSTTTSTTDHHDAADDHQHHHHDGGGQHLDHEQHDRDHHLDDPAGDHVHLHDDHSSPGATDHAGAPAATLRLHHHLLLPRRRRATAGSRRARRRAGAWRPRCAASSIATPPRIATTTSAELRRIGQVTSDGQAAELARYFAKVERSRRRGRRASRSAPKGTGPPCASRVAIASATRPAALVTQESPPIEKRVVRGPDGLRFEPGAR